MHRPVKYELTLPQFHYRFSISQLNGTFTPFFGNRNGLIRQLSDNIRHFHTLQLHVCFKSSLSKSCNFFGCRAPWQERLLHLKTYLQTTIGIVLITIILQVLVLHEMLEQYQLNDRILLVEQEILTPIKIAWTSLEMYRVTLLYMS